MSASILEHNSVDQQLQSLTALVLELRAEVRDLRLEDTKLLGQLSVLRCEVGYWKSRHADAVKRNVKLQAELDQANAEIRQLKADRLV